MKKIIFTVIAVVSLAACGLGLTLTRAEDPGASTPVRFLYNGTYAQHIITGDCFLLDGPNTMTEVACSEAGFGEGAIPYSEWEEARERAEDVVEDIRSDEDVQNLEARGRGLIARGLSWAKDKVE